MANLTELMGQFRRAEAAGDTAAIERIRGAIAQIPRASAAAPPSDYQKTETALTFPDFAKLRRSDFERIAADFRQLHQQHRVAKAELQQASQKAYNLERENRQLSARLQEKAADEDYLASRVRQLEARIQELENASD